MRHGVLDRLRPNRAGAGCYYAPALPGPVRISRRSLLGGTPLVAARAQARPPNFVVIVADDHGWNDAGLLRPPAHPHSASGPAGFRGRSVYPLLHDRTAVQPRTGSRPDRALSACVGCHPPRARRGRSPALDAARICGRSPAACEGLATRPRPHGSGTSRPRARERMASTMPSPGRDTYLEQSQAFPPAPARTAVLPVLLSHSHPSALPGASGIRVSRRRGRRVPSSVPEGHGAGPGSLLLVPVRDEARWTMRSASCSAHWNGPARWTARLSCS